MRRLSALITICPSDDNAGKPFVVCRHNVPRRVLRRRCLNHGLNEQEHRGALIVADREERVGSPSELLAEVDRDLQ